MNRGEGWAPYPGAATPFGGIAKGAMADLLLPGLPSNDPKNCLSEAARRRVEDAHLESQLIRTKALAIIETRYRSGPTHELSFGDYFKTGQAAIEWDEAKVESARIVLSTLVREYVAAGKSGRELGQIMGEELEGACYSLELSIPQRDLLSLEIEVNRRSLAQSTEARPAVTAAKSDGKGRKRGPTPDYEAASRLAEIIARVAPDGEWRGKLDEICEALDQTEPKLPCPRVWHGRYNADCWADYPERSTAIKVIEDRLRVAKQKPKPAPETSS